MSIQRFVNPVFITVNVQTTFCESSLTYRGCQWDVQTTFCEYSLIAGVQITSLCPVWLTTGVQITSMCPALLIVGAQATSLCLQSYLLQVSRPLSVSPFLLHVSRSLACVQSYLLQVSRLIACVQSYLLQVSRSLACVQSYLLQVSSPLAVGPVLLTVGVQTTSGVQSYLLLVFRPLSVCPVLLTAGVHAARAVSSRTATGTYRTWTDGVAGGASPLGVSGSDPGARAPEFAWQRGWKCRQQNPWTEENKKGTYGKVFWYDVRGHM